jgi:hypothetical protein
LSKHAVPATVAAAAAWRWHVARCSLADQLTPAFCATLPYV